MWSPVAMSKLWHCWFPEVNWVPPGEALSGRELDAGILNLNPVFSIRVFIIIALGKSFIFFNHSFFFFKISQQYINLTRIILKTTYM